MTKAITRRQGVALVAVAVLAVAAIASVTVAGAAGSLISHWGGEGDATDSADANDGTLVGDTTFATGQVGQAFSFDGLGDYVRVADSANLQVTGAITISAWFKTSGTNSFSGIVGKMTQFEPRPGYLMNVNNSSKLRCDIIGPLGRIIQGQGTVVSGTSVEDGVFHHGACTYDGTTVRVYVDGVLEGSVAYANGIGSNNGQPLRIGRDAAFQPNRDFNGLIDEVKVHNKALSAQDIQDLFEDGDDDSDDDSEDSDDSDDSDDDDDSGSDD